MKRKLFIAVVAVLLICLTCGMLLVACNKKGGGNGGKVPTPTPTEWKANGEEMLKEVYDKIASDISVKDGKDFVADFDITLNIDDKKDSSKNMLLRLMAKGSVDVREGHESAFIVQVSNVTDPQKEIVYFGLAYDGESSVDGQTPYLYVNVANGGYKKVNGFSLTQLVASISAANTNKDAGGVTTADGFDIQQIIDNIKQEPKYIFDVLKLAGLLDKGTMRDSGKTYEVPLNIAGCFNTVYGIAKTKIPAGVLGAMNGILGKDFQTMDELATFIANALNRVKTVVTVKFDENDHLLQANAVVDCVDGNYQPVGQYTLTVNKAVLNLGDMPDVFAGTAITDEVKAQEAINLLKFSFDAKVLGYDQSNLDTPNRYYNVSVNMDIDPFVLMELIGKSTGEGANARIAAAIKSLGYIDITIDEVDSENAFVKNILTIHSDTSEGIVVAAISTHKAMQQVSLGVGGVYDIDELVNVVGMLIAKSKTNGAATAAVDFNKVLDVITKVTSYFGYFDIKNVAGGSVTMNASDFVKALFKQLTGAELNQTVEGALKDVIGSDVLTINLGDFRFGECTTRSLADIKANIRTNSNTFGNDDSSISDNLVKKITSIGIEGKQIAKGDGNIYNYMKNTNAGYDIYEMKGIDLTGKEVTTSGFIFRTEGFNPDTVGKQKVKFYIAIANDFVEAKSTIESKPFGGNKLDIDPLVPLYGVLVYETEVEVVEQVSGSVAASFASGYADGTLTLKNGKSMAQIGDGVFMFTIPDVMMFPQVIVWDGSKLVVKDGAFNTIDEKFTDIKITLTSDAMPVPIDIATGLSQYASSVVVGQGAAWQGFWFTSGTVKFELKYDGKDVMFNGSATNIFKYVVA